MATKNILTGRNLSLKRFHVPSQLFYSYPSLFHFQTENTRVVMCRVPVK